MHLRPSRLNRGQRIVEVAVDQLPRRALPHQAHHRSKPHSAEKTVVEGIERECGEHHVLRERLEAGRAACYPLWQNNGAGPCVFMAARHGIARWRQVRDGAFAGFREFGAESVPAGRSDGSPRSTGSSARWASAPHEKCRTRDRTRRTRRKAGASRAAKVLPSACSCPIRAARASSKARPSLSTTPACSSNRSFRRRPISALQPHSKSGSGLSAGNGSKGCRPSHRNITWARNHRRTLCGVGSARAGRPTRLGLQMGTARIQPATAPQTTRSRFAFARLAAPTVDPQTPALASACASSLRGDFGEAFGALRLSRRSPRNVSMTESLLTHQTCLDQTRPTCFNGRRPVTRNSGHCLRPNLSTYRQRRAGSRFKHLENGRALVVEQGVSPVAGLKATQRCPHRFDQHAFGYERSAPNRRRHRRQGSHRTPGQRRPASVVTSVRPAGYLRQRCSVAVNAQRWHSVRTDRASDYLPKLADRPLCY